MKTIIILAHPNIDQSVVNKSWIEALAQKNPEAKIHNIYKNYPDWKIDVAKEQALLEKYDRIILQFPIYWYNMPPLLKKWLDDVFAYGWAYGSTGNKLAGKEFGLAVSTGGAESAYTPDQYGTINELLKPLESTAKFVSAKYIPYHVFHGALSPDVQDRLAVNTEEYVNKVTQPC